MKCCVEIATPDGRLIPFCSYNNVGYREEVRDEMVKQRARDRIVRISASNMEKGRRKGAKRSKDEAAMEKGNSQ